MDFKSTLSEKLKNIKLKLNEDLIPGGKGDNKTPEDIAKKHGVSVEDIKKEIELGIKKEMEHTKDKNKAEEISTDHVTEHPKYYSDKKHGLNANEKKLNEATVGNTPSDPNVVRKQKDAAMAKSSAMQKQAEADKAEADSLKVTATKMKEDDSKTTEVETIESPKEELTNTGITPEQEIKIKDFLITNKGLDDTKFHEFVKAMGIDPHEAEELVYKIVYDLGTIILGNENSTEIEQEPIDDVEDDEYEIEDSRYLKEAWKKVVNRKFKK